MIMRIGVNATQQYARLKMIQCFLLDESDWSNGEEWRMGRDNERSYFWQDGGFLL